MSLEDRVIEVWKSSPTNDVSFIVMLMKQKYFTQKPPTGAKVCSILEKAKEDGIIETNYTFSWFYTPMEVDLLLTVYPEISKFSEQTLGIYRSPTSLKKKYEELKAFKLLKIPLPGEHPLESVTQVPTITGLHSVALASAYLEMKSTGRLITNMAEYKNELADIAPTLFEEGKITELTIRTIMGTL